MQNRAARIPVRPSTTLIILVMMLWLVIPSPASAQDLTATTLGDYGNVTVMEAAGSYDAWNADGTENEAARQAVANEFFRTHKDEYDFLVIFTNFDHQMIEAGSAAFYHPVRNDIRGIGQPLFDNSAEYGSAGRLQGAVDMGNIAGHVMDPLDPRFERTLTTLSHEILHRWAAQVKLKNAAGVMTTALLGRNGSHWSFLFDSGGSLLYGNRWKDNGNNTFTSQVPLSEMRSYGPLDLYLMGMIGPEQVPPMLLIESPSVDPDRLTEANVTISGAARYVTIDDISDANGPREPAVARSPKTFKTAIIFLVRPGTFSGQEIYGIENIRNGAVTRFSVLTDGKSIMEVATTPKDDVPTNPGPLPPNNQPRTADPSIADGVAWLTLNQQHDGSWLDIAQTRERDTAEAVLTLQDFPSAQEGRQLGLAWLNSMTSGNIDFLSRKIEALAAAQLDVSPLVQELLSRRNADGGWGGDSRYASSSADTAMALRALAAAGYADLAVLGKAIEFLRSRQNPDNGWGSDDRGSLVQETSRVLAAFHRYRGAFPLDDRIAAGQAWLTGKRNPDGGFGNSPSTIYDTAVASLTLRELNVPTEVTNPAIDHLRARQTQNGSWDQSAYATALATRALQKGTVDPDLVVRPGDIAVIPEKLTSLPTTFAISVAVANTGLTAVPQAVVQLYEGPVTAGNRIGEQTVAVPGQSVTTVLFAAEAVDGREHRFTVVVDPENAVQESNEGNNRAVKSLQVEATYDFEVLSSGVTVAPAAVDLLQDVTISAKIANKGTTTAYSVPVAFTVGTFAVATVPVDIPANGSVTKTVTWRANQTGTDLPVVVRVDPLYAFVELSETNNSASGTVTVNALTDPNLSVSYRDITIAPSPAPEGGGMTITATVRNDGGSAAANAVVRIFSTVSGSAVQLPPGAPAALPLPPLDPGQSATVSLTWNSIPDAGQKTITVRADLPEGVREIRSDDNEAFTTVTVLSLPDLAISANAVSVQPAFPKEGDPAAITVTVQNSGDQDARDVTVQLLENGAAIGERTVPLISGHATASASFLYDTTGKTGAREITVIVDPGNAIAERIKENNRAVRSFAVQDANLWVSERYFSPNGDGVKDSTQFFFRLAAPQTVTVAVVSKKGATVRTFSGAGLQNIDAGSVVWDGLNDDGMVVEDGEYRLRVLGSGGELGAAMVIVDNNRSSLVEAMDTIFLLNNNLTCLVPYMWNWKWFTDESGIVFVLDSELQNSTTYAPGLYAMAPDGDGVTRLIPGDWTRGRVNGTDHDYHVIDYAPSPDNNNVAFVVNRYNWRKGYADLSQLWVVSRDGTGLRLLVTRDLLQDYRPITGLAWSPQGNSIVYQDSGTGYELWLISAEGSSPVRIDTLGSSLYIRDAQWSPDGRRLVYPDGRYDAAGNWTVMIKVYEPGGASTVIDTAGYVARIEWLDTARVLLSEYMTAFGSDLDRLRVLEIDAPGTGRVITDRLTGIPVVSQVGGRFAFQTREGGNAYLNVAEASGAVRSIDEIAPGGGTCEPGISGIAWSPDGRRLGYKKTLMRYIPDQEIIYCIEPLIVVQNADTGEKRIIEGLDREYSFFGWMSDGKTLAAAAEEYYGGGDLVFLNGDTGELTTAISGGWRYELSPRERYLTYAKTAPEMTACADGGVADLWATSSLLNLTADLRVTRDRYSVKLKGIAADLNFEGYRLEYADAKSPAFWQPVMPPADTPVMGGLFTTWVPPAAGTYHVKLTVGDRAGNTGIDRKRISWGRSASISNLFTEPRLFSPNGDGVRDFVELRYRANEAVHLEFTVRNKESVIVRTFSREHAAPADGVVTWDGRDEYGAFVPDGEYTIGVLDLLFPVTVDNSLPDARLEFSSVYLDHNASQARTILVGHAEDENFKRWILEYSSGSEPTIWREYRQSERAIKKRSDTDNHLAVLDVFGLIPLVDREFRLTAEDAAGNRRTVLSGPLAERVLLNKYDGAQLRASNGNVTLKSRQWLELKPGIHTFDAFSTVRRPVMSWTVQYSQDLMTTTDKHGDQRHSWENWKDVLVENEPPQGVVQLQWRAPAFDPLKPCAVRIKATDDLGNEHFSDLIVVHNVFRVQQECAPDTADAAFRVHYFAFTADVRQLRFQTRPSSQQWQDISFSLEPGGKLTTSLPVPGAPLPFGSFMIYVPGGRLPAGGDLPIRMIGSSDEGEHISEVSTYVPVLDPFDRTADQDSIEFYLEVLQTPQECGGRSTGKALLQGGIRWKTSKIKIDMKVLPPAGTLFDTVSYSMGLPSGATQQLGTFVFHGEGFGGAEVDVSSFPEGRYWASAALKYQTNCKLPGERTAGEYIYSDRVLPVAVITAPAPSSTVCAVQAGTANQEWYYIPVSVATSDDRAFRRYELLYSQGDPADNAWTRARARIGKDSVDIYGTKPIDGQIGPWDITGLPGSAYSLLLSAVDKAGNTTCSTTNFVISDRVTISGLRSDMYLFSPNDDGVLDAAAIAFDVEDHATATVRVHRQVSNTAYDPTPLRTIALQKNYPGGSATETWDGRDDSGAVVGDGRYAIVVTAGDACGHRAEKWTGIVVDATPPVTTIHFPRQGDAFGTIVTVTGIADDPHFRSFLLEVGQGPEPTAWLVLKSGRTPVKTGELGVWNNFGIAGEWTLRLTAHDSSGNSRVVTSLINLDERVTLISDLTVSPEVVSPNSDGRADSARIRFSVTDVCDATLEISRQGSIVKEHVMTGLSAGGHTFAWDGTDNAGSRVPDDTYTIRLTASQPPIMESESLTVVIDATKPTIALSHPEPDAFLTDLIVPVKGSITDTNLSGYSLSYSGGSPGGLIDEGKQSRIDHLFGTLHDLPEGPYSVDVSADDLGMNGSLERISFTIDRTPPVVKLDAPKEGTFFGTRTPATDEEPADTAHITGSIEEMNLETYSLRYGAGSSPQQWTDLVTGTAVPKAPQLFSWTVGKDDGIPDGVYTLSLFARDKAGLTGEKRVLVSVDNTPPVAQIAAPEPGGYVRSGADIRGTAADANLASYGVEISEGTCDSAFKWAAVRTAAAPVENGVLAQWPAVPADGDYCLRLTVTDKVGSRNEARVDVKVDTTPPSAPVLSGKRENGVDASLSWNSSSESDLAGYNLYRGGQKLNSALLAEAFYLDAGLGEGTYIYTVTARDFAGNESGPSNAVTIRIDLNGPAARIASPKNGATLNGYADIKGTAHSSDDFRQYRVLLGTGAAPDAWSVVRTSPVPVLYGVLAELDTLPLSEGQTYTLQLEAEDLAGNVTTDRITVTVDNLPPAAPVLLSAAADGTDVTLAWQEVADPGLAGYALYRNGRLANASTSMAGDITPYLIRCGSFLNYGLPDGTFTYAVAAVDLAGNMSDLSNELTVTIDMRAPVIAIVAPPAVNGRAEIGGRTTVGAESPDLDIETVTFYYAPQGSTTWSSFGSAAREPYAATFDPSAIGLPYGEYPVKAEAVDRHLPEGNRGVSPVITLVYKDLTPPPTPAGFRAQVQGGSVTLTWNAATDSDTAGYRIYRTQGSLRALITATALARTTAAHQDSPWYDDTYRYDITAIDASGNESKPSQPASARIYAPELAWPGSVTAQQSLTVHGGNATPGASVAVAVLADSGGGSAGAATAGAAGLFQAEVILGEGGNAITAIATDGNGNVSKVSNAVSVFYDAPPAAPSGLAAQVQGGSVLLTWTPALEGDVQGYHVYQSSGSGWTRTTQSPVPDAGWTDERVPNGAYVYRVTALDAVSESAPSNEAPATVFQDPPQPPVLLGVNALGNGDLVVTWEHPAGASDYRVYRSEVSGGPYSAASTRTVTGMSFQDTGLAHGSAYYYVVTAADTAGNESAYSNEGMGVSDDREPPQQPVITAPTRAGMPVTVQGRTTDISGTSDPGATVELIRDGRSMGRTTAQGGGGGQSSYPLGALVHNATMSPDGSKLAYQTDDDVLRVLDLMTSTSVSIAEMARDPYWSPDGSKIAYRSQWTYPNRIMVHDVAANTALPLTGEMPQNVYAPFSWNATGDRFVFRGYSYGPTVYGDALWLKDLATGALTPVVVKSPIYDHALSPDGEKLAYFDGANLVVLDLITGQETAIETAIDGWSVSWAADSGTIAYVAWNGDGTDLYAAEPSGNHRTLLARSAGNQYWTAWLPDGQTVAYTDWDPAAGADSVKTVPADGTAGPTTIEEGLAGVVHLAAAGDGAVVYVDSNYDSAASVLKVASRGGRFLFLHVPLEVGVNIFTATAADRAGNSSAASEPISVLSDISTLPDLAVSASDLSLYPAAPVLGDITVANAVIRNLGGASSPETDYGLYVWNAAGHLDLLGSGRIPVLAAGAAHLVNAVWDSRGRSGDNRLVAVVDTDALAVESDESNNMAIREFFVADRAGFTLSAKLDAENYSAGSDVRITVTAWNSGAQRSGTLVARIEDRTGSVVAYLGSQGISVPYASSQSVAFTWNTGGTFAGAYQARAVLTDASGAVVESLSPFAVTRDGMPQTSIATDKTGYGANEQVRVSIGVNNQSRNWLIAELVTRITVTNAAGGIVFTDEKNMTDVLPGSSLARSAVWNTGVSTPGSYTASLEAIVDGSPLPVKSARFTIRGTAVMKGTIAVAPAPVPYGTAYRAVYSLGNSGNADSGPITARILIIDPDTKAVLDSYESQTSVVTGGTATDQAEFSAGSRSLKTYTAVLQNSSADGTVVLASAPVVVKDMTAPTITVLAPGEGNIYTSTVAFSVSAADDASGIAQVEYRRDSGTWSLLPAADPARGRFGTTWEPTMANNGQHRVSYRATDRSGNTGQEATVTYEVRINRAPTAPALSAPADGADVGTPFPVLTVSNATDPNGDALTYAFEMYADSDLQMAVSTAGGIAEGAGTTSWQSPAELRENSTYYWRSRAFDGKLYGPWMPVAAFRVNAVEDPPSAPMPTSPADGTEVPTLSPVLTVINAVDSDSADLTYNFEVAQDPLFSTITASVLGVFGADATTSWQVSDQLAEDTWYYWRAQADDWTAAGPWSAPFRFFVNTGNNAPAAPVVIAPQKGSTVSTIAPDIVLQNSRDPDSAVISYYFEVDSMPTFDSDSVIRSGVIPEGYGTTTWQAVGLRDNTVQYVRAKASDGAAESLWSETVRFFVNTMNDAPTTPVPVEPSDGAGVNVFSPTLVVTNATDLDHDPLTYEFEVHRDAGLDVLAARGVGVPEGDSTTSWTVPAALLENHTYYWRARAFDGRLPGDWTSLQSFTINTGNEPPSAPVPVFPSDGSTIDILQPTFKVLNAIDPDSDRLTYEFALFEGTTLVWSTTGVAEGADGRTSATVLTALVHNTQYQWQARAHDGDRYGPWSTPARFTVHLPRTGITANMRFEPETLNRTSKGNWVMVELTFPEGYRAADIDIRSIRLEGTVPAEPKPFSLTPERPGKGPSVKVKFLRSAVIALLPAGEKVPVRASGMISATPFEGLDIIRVIH